MKAFGKWIALILAVAIGTSLGALFVVRREKEIAKWEGAAAAISQSLASTVDHHRKMIDLGSQMGEGAAAVAKAKADTKESIRRAKLFADSAPSGASDERLRLAIESATSALDWFSP